MVFYKNDEIVHLKRKKVFLFYLQTLIILAALIMCIVCCIMTNTLNEQRMLFTAVTVSTLAGWLVILLFVLCYQPARALYQHKASIISNTEPALELKGTIRRTEKIVHIPKSIDIEKVILTAENGEETRLNVIAVCGKHLPADNRIHTIKAIRNYIVEVDHE